MRSASAWLIFAFDTTKKGIAARWGKVSLLWLATLLPLRKRPRSVAHSRIGLPTISHAEGQRWVRSGDVPARLLRSAKALMERVRIFGKVRDASRPHAYRFKLGTRGLNLRVFPGHLREQ